MTDAETTPRDEIVRLSANFIEDAQKREAVLVMLAFAELLMDVPARVSEPLLGDIRYTWWAEAIGEIAAGGQVRYHPLSAALAPVVREGGLDTSALLTAIEAHRIMLDGKLSLRDALVVADQGQAAVVKQAARLLAPDTDTDALSAPLRLHALATLKSAGRLKDEEAGHAELRHLYRDARAAMRKAPTPQLPLVLPAAMAPDQWRGRVRGALSVRLKLLWAFVTGRI